MLTHPVFCAVIGTALGFLSGLGVGGGSLLMLWLTVVLEAPQEYARLMNLLFFVPCAVAAFAFRFRSKKVSWSILLTAMAAGCIGSVIGNLLGRQLDLERLRKVFGVFFVICGFRELTYRPRKFK